MPLVMSPIREQDALAWVRIRTLAYMFLGPTHELVHNGPVSETSIRAVAEDRKHELQSPNTWFWKIVDTSLEPSEDDAKDNGGRTIACAVWSAHNVDHEKFKEVGLVKPEDGEGSQKSAADPSEVAEKRKPFVPPELRLEVIGSLFGPLAAAKTEIMGSKPYLELNGLVTHPDHHRRGAGSILLKWGIGKADQLGVETYLDSTGLAKALYERWGFESVRAIEWDRTEWGGEGKDCHWAMVRKPKAKSDA